MIEETDLTLADGRTLHCYDSGDAGGLTVFWHHGSPNTGAPPEPLFPAAAERGIRWVSYDRPGYMSSTARPGRDKASVAADAAVVADAAGAGDPGYRAVHVTAVNDKPTILLPATAVAAKMGKPAAALAGVDHGRETQGAGCAAPRCHAADQVAAAGGAGQPRRRRSTGHPR